MRLLNANTLELHEFFESEVPPYAILSHTWGKEEVTFQDMSKTERFKKKGYRKLEESCRLTKLDKLEFVWIDTCCIDKSSSSELSESINSMFGWYERAVVCYVYLEDLSTSTTLSEGLFHCRWCTRGWTLQELIAPRTLIFYDESWSCKGSKLEHLRTIFDATGVDKELLERGPSRLSFYSVATKMAFAAKRQTTRLEDMAYCLLGMFDVNMALIYGEGMKAFRRLQEEIVRRNNDLTIFAWEMPSQAFGEFYPLFAPSPAAFTDSSMVPYTDDHIDFSITNKGLQISGDMPMRVVEIYDHQNNPHGCYLIHLGDVHPDVHEAGGILLRKVGPRLYHRYYMDGIGLDLKNVEQIDIIQTNNDYILLDANRSSRLAVERNSQFAMDAIHVPRHKVFHLRKAIPEVLWDVTSRTFLRPTPYSWSRYDVALAMTFQVLLESRVVDLIVLCDYRNEEDSPQAKLFRAEDYPREKAVLFQGRCKAESIPWTDLEVQLPSVSQMTNSIAIQTRNGLFAIIAWFTPDHDRFKLEFAISGGPDL